MLDIRDPGHRSVYFFGVYEEEVTGAVRQALVEGATFLDVGANAGFYSVLANSLGADVHAFEPSPEALVLLRRTVALNPGITLNEVAVGAEPGRAQLFLAPPSEANTGLATLNASEASGGRAVEVAVTTLDDYCSDLVVSLIKLDIEGFEHAALAGARSVLLRDRPVLISENSLGVRELLADLGYSGRPLGEWNTLFTPPAAGT